MNIGAKAALVATCLLALLGPRGALGAGLLVPDVVSLDQEEVEFDVRFAAPPVFPIIETGGVGRIDRVYRINDTDFEAVWVLPSDNTPRVAVLAAWDDADFDPDIMAARVSLTASADLPVLAPEGARVTVDVGGVTYGPKVSPATGLLSFVVDAPPGVREARVYVEDADGQETSSTVGLGLDLSPLVSVLLLPNRAPGDGYEFVRLHMFGSDYYGYPTEAETLEVSVGTSFFRSQAVEPGYFVSDFQVPRHLVDQELTVSALIEDETPGTATLFVAGVPPEQFAAEVEPGEVVADASARVEVRARLSDGVHNPPLTGLPVSFRASAGQFSEPYEVERGLYQADYSPPTVIPPLGFVEVIAYLESNVEGSDPLESRTQLQLLPGAPRLALVRATPSSITPDGRSVTLVTVEATDVHHNRVDAEISLELDVGEKSDIDYSGPGSLSFTYTAPNLPDLEGAREVEIAVRSGDVDLRTTGRVTLFREPPPIKVVEPRKPLARPLMGLAAGGAALTAPTGFKPGAIGPLFRVDYSRALAAGVHWHITSGMFWSSAQSSLRGADFSDEAAAVDTETTTMGVPLMGGIGYRMDIGSGLTLYTGFELGALVARTTLEAPGVLPEPLASTELAPALAIPIAVERLLGPGRVQVGLHHQRTLTSVGEARSTGVHGPIVTTTALVGYRYEL